jgi:hypothetical protein
VTPLYYRQETYAHALQAKAAAGRSTGTVGVTAAAELMRTTVDATTGVTAAEGTQQGGESGDAGGGGKKRSATAAGLNQQVAGAALGLQVRDAPLQLEMVMRNPA